MAYAETTTVSVEKTEADIKGLLRKHGATSFMTGEEPRRATIAFQMKDRRIIFRLPLPDQNEQRFLYDARQRERTAQAKVSAWEQACRSRWRALFLCIKAKLESVESGIETMEEAFMAHVMLPDGGTVGEHITPKIAEAYLRDEMFPLLPAPLPSDEGGE